MSITSSSARRVRRVASLPATCSPGEIVLKTSGGSEGLHICITANNWVLLDAAAGDGTVTSVSVVTANGLSGTVANPTTTPAITLNIAALDAAKIGGGGVSTTEFDFLGGVTSDIQTQLNAREVTANKSTDVTTDGASDTKYPSVKAVKDYVDAAGGAGYLVYTALLTQTGTDAPVATILQNTLGGTPVWGYTSAGLYTVTLAGVFTVNKTVIFVQPMPINASANRTNLLQLTHTSADVITLKTMYQNGSDSLTATIDGVLVDVGIEIRVFPS
jgi:hypothetical protein